MDTDEKPKLKMPPEVRFLSVPETAFIMAVSTDQVRTWIKEGRLRAYRIGANNNLTLYPVKILSAACDRIWGLPVVVMNNASKLWWLLLLSVRTTDQLG
jgi:excisionase family DNA binding protein